MSKLERIKKKIFGRLETDEECEARFVEFESRHPDFVEKHDSYRRELVESRAIARELKVIGEKEITLAINESEGPKVISTRTVNVDGKNVTVEYLKAESGFRYYKGDGACAFCGEFTCSGYCYK